MKTQEINIAFCFDENLWMQAGVAIYSLLYNSNDNYRYNIYCVVDKSIPQSSLDILKDIVSKYSKLSTITFVPPSNEFEKINTGIWGIASMHRLLLYKLFPNLDRIIYTDVDVIFTSNLHELYSVELEDNYLAAVKDSFSAIPTDQSSYINSGVLVMNLKAIRDDKLYEKWFALSKQRFAFPDQDILNISCRGKIKYIDKKYNSNEKDAVICHYSGHQPWKCYDIDLKFDRGYMWWYYAKEMPFYVTLLKRYVEYRIDYRSPKFPRWIIFVICWFVPSKNTRKHIRNKYAYEKISR
jgi:lipopolysaccharide biosynthesis glycosyltransferase